MYTDKNFKTKKALKDAIKAGERVTYFQPGLFAGDEPLDGTIYLEGPHYPEAHTWYAQAIVQNGVVIRIVK
jgi:hypothetical protein